MHHGQVLDVFDELVAIGHAAQASGRAVGHLSISASLPNAIERSGSERSCARDQGDQRLGRFGAGLPRTGSITQVSLLSTVRFLG